MSDLIARIRELVELLEDSDVDSIEISRLWTRITIRKSPPTPERIAIDPSPPPASPSAAPAEGAAPSPGDGETPGSAEGAGTAAAAATGPEEAGEARDELHEVESPMVGTFYRAPAPDAPPYVEVGDRVEKGQTLCILEAMKLMNELESELSGEIREVCVQNSEPVEYGQVLFRIAPASSG